MGPGAGEHGGYVVAEGTADDVMRNKRSVTGQFLSGKRTIAIPPRREDDRGHFTVRGAAMHNLKGIDVEFPVGKFVCVTGVSGSGKSTLVNEIVYKALANRLNRMRVKPGEHDDVEGIEVFDKVIDIDQTPIGRTPRSNPATYIDLFTHIRELYSLTPGSQGARLQARPLLVQRPRRPLRDLQGRRARSRSRCTSCPTSTCRARRATGTATTSETLEVRFKGKSIADVLEMSVEEALELLREDPEDPPAAADAARRRARLHQARPAGDDALGRRGAAREARRRALARSRPAGRSTSSTSRRPASTSPTSRSCSRCSSGSSTPATRCS